MSDPQIDQQNSKYTPFKCVVCNGFGTLKYGQKTCQGCKGRGYVVINNDTGLPVIEGQIDGNSTA